MFLKIKEMKGFLHGWVFNPAVNVCALKRDSTRKQLTYQRGLLFMPNVKVSFLHGLIGALVATVLFEVTKRLFGLYIVNFNNYEVVYGALATLPIFLIWIYLSWVVALIGAEVVAVLQQRAANSSVDSDATEALD